MELRGAWNSRRPWGINDGALWQGRGATGAFTAGAWMLGLQKSTDPTPERIWRFAAELTILGSSRTTLVRVGVD